VVQLGHPSGSHGDARRRTSTFGQSATRRTHRSEWVRLASCRPPQEQTLSVCQSAAITTSMTNVAKTWPEILKPALVS
jgi:hypothetical protein